MDRQWVLFSERVHQIDFYESMNDIIANCQSSYFISQLSVRYFDLRY